MDIIPTKSIMVFSFYANAEKYYIPEGNSSVCSCFLARWRLTAVSLDAGAGNWFVRGSGILAFYFSFIVYSKQQLLYLFHITYFETKNRSKINPFTRPLMKSNCRKISEAQECISMWTQVYVHTRPLKYKHNNYYIL